MRILGFHISAFNDFLEWSNTNKPIFKKLNSIIKDILRNPFAGLGNQNL